MKKQNRFRAAALFFALLLISAALLCSCGKTGGDVPGTSDVGTSEAPESGTLDVIKDGKIALVRVVRSADISSSDAPEIVAAKRLRTAVGNFMEELGVNQGYDGTLALEEDILMPGQSYDHSTFEILIGATGYDESSSAFDGLGYGDYTVKLVGNKIVIVAYTSTGYLSAVSKLTTLMRKGMNTDTKSISLEKSEIDFNGTSDEKLAAIPFYSGGKFGSYYKTGNSVDEIIIKKTNTDEYGAYLEALKSAGYTCYTQNEIASSKFATYTNDSYTLSVRFYKYESSVHRSRAGRGARSAQRRRIHQSDDLDDNAVRACIQAEYRYACGKRNVVSDTPHGRKLYNHRRRLQQSGGCRSAHKRDACSVCRICLKGFGYQGRCVDNFARTRRSLRRCQAVRAL